MNNWKKYTLVALMVTAGFAYFNNSRQHIPTDLRDAVAMDQLQGSTSDETVALPAPVGVKAAAVKAPSAPLPGFIAGVALNDLEGDTAFDKLGSLFKEGVPATKEDLTGWYAGRTVNGGLGNGSDTAVQLENTFVAAVLVGKEMPLAGGPLFEGESQFLVLFVGKSNASQDHYDNGMSPDAMSSIEGLFNTDAKLLKFPGATYTVKTSETKEVIAVRKARGYIIVHAKHYVVRTGRGHRDYLDAETYSYYFKDVTPKK